MTVLTKKASEIMTRPVISARENASARDVALQLMNGLFSGMPVTNAEGKVVGIITELDLLKAVQDGKELVRTTAKDIMTPDVATAREDACVQHQHIDTTEVCSTLFNRVDQLSIVSHITGDAKHVCTIKERFNSRVDIQRYDRCATREHRFNTGLTDARGGARDQRNLTLKHRWLAALA